MTAIGLRDGSRVIAGVLFSALVVASSAEGSLGGTFYHEHRTPARNAVRLSATEPFQPSTAVLYEPGAARSFLVLAPGTLDSNLKQAGLKS